MSDELPHGEFVPYAFAEITDGSTRHGAGGNVTLYLDNETNEWVLYFQGYEASAAPDARFFLCEHPDPMTRDEIDSCTRLSVPGRGPADVRGDFLVPIPEDVDPQGHGSVVAWDLRFNHRLAVAHLDPMEP